MSTFCCRTLYMMLWWPLNNTVSPINFSNLKKNAFQTIISQNLMRWWVDIFPNQFYEFLAMIENCNLHRMIMQNVEPVFQKSGDSHWADCVPSQFHEFFKNEFVIFTKKILQNVAIYLYNAVMAVEPDMSSLSASSLRIASSHSRKPWKKTKWSC